MRKIDDEFDVDIGGGNYPPNIPTPTPSATPTQEERDRNWHTFVIAGIIFVMLLGFFAK